MGGPVSPAPASDHSRRQYHCGFGLRAKDAGDAEAFILNASLKTRRTGVPQDSLADTSSRTAGIRRQHEGPSND